MEEVRRNTTRYLSYINIRKTADADIEDVWFDCNIPLNFDMVAIIGNKGSGKRPVPVGNQTRRMVETSLEAVALCGASLLI